MWVSVSTSRPRLYDPGPAQGFLPLKAVFPVPARSNLKTNDVSDYVCLKVSRMTLSVTCCPDSLVFVVHILHRLAEQRGDVR